MPSTTFTVDAALLRELGDRLIGRSYIALAELVKNAYDADATHCRIEFCADRIIVSDNGHGMSSREFHERWLRIGTTHKATAKVSRRFRRPLTGSKGLGRLSAQFLADKLLLQTTSPKESSHYLEARLDWTAIRRDAAIGTFAVLWDLLPGQQHYPNTGSTGTRLILNGLRSTWTTDEVANLGKHLWMLQSPFPASDGSLAEAGKQDFHVHIDAPGIDRAKEAFHSVRTALFRHWRARIRGFLLDGRARNTKAVLSVEFRKGYPEEVPTANSFHQEVPLPVSAEGTGDSAIDRVRFEIFVFKTTGRQPAGISVDDMRTYLREFGNVSVYDAGFRLPYYGASQDWLNVAVDQGRRLNTSRLLPSSLHTGERYLLDLPAPARIFGTVEIDTAHERRIADQEEVARPGACLQISPGRRPARRQRGLRPTS